MANLHNAQSVQISLGGKVLGTAREFMTDESRAMETVNVLGQSTPYAVVPKNKEFTGSLKMLSLEADTFVRNLPAGTTPTDAELTIVAVYTTPGIPTYSEVLTGVRITKWSRKVTQGDAFIEIDIPFTFVNIARA